MITNGSYEGRVIFLFRKVKSRIILIRNMTHHESWFMMHHITRKNAGAVGKCSFIRQKTWKLLFDHKVDSVRELLTEKLDYLANLENVEFQDRGKIGENNSLRSFLLMRSRSFPCKTVFQAIKINLILVWLIREIKL